MNRSLTPKKRVESKLAFVNMRRRKPLEKSLSKKGSPSKATRRLEKLLSRSTKIAFRKAGLDINNDDDWILLLALLCGALYSRTPGRPEEWKKQKLRELWKAFATAKAKDPKLSEKAICKALVQTDLYSGLKPETLRRRLQQAKLPSRSGRT